MKTLKLLAAVLVPAALIAAAGTASAAGPKKKPGKIFRALVKDGALTKADLKPLKPIVKELRGCHADVKSGAKPAGSCKMIRARLMQAHVRLLKKAAPRIKSKRLKARVEAKVQRVNKHLAKTKAAAP